MLCPYYYEVQLTALFISLKHMRRDPNLLKSDTMKRMKKFLKSMNEDLSEKIKYVFRSLYIFRSVCA